jgi:hypothetical protein
MSHQPTQRNLSRRKALAGIGVGGLILAQGTTTALAQEKPADTNDPAVTANLARFHVVSALKSHLAFQEGELVETTGFHMPGDGGGALYRIQKLDKYTRPNEADIIALKDGLVAVLLENEAVNYRMFGALGDGKNDDGVQIKLAHEYAERHRIPIVNLSGNFWIQRANNIPIATNVHWGNTTLHIDEKYNKKSVPRFVVHDSLPPQDLAADEELKAVLLEKLKPGVQIIDELAPYAGHLVSVADEGDRIGIRAGNYSKRGWAREELFYVEEEGRIIGDIAWEFKNITSATAKPCNNNYLVIEGGGLCLSGETPAESSPGYHQNGILVQRSRTIIRDQWVGLESGCRDNSLEPRSGFYTLSRVYDVTLENIRAMPWEKSRRDKTKAVQHGTYGIGGARMLNCTFRNLTAEGGWVSWGVFGTNLNKNFRVENCRLNRIDVHFHCWNLYISDCTIGFKGISVTGGGDLFIENTTRHGNYFVHFRPDYGAKWDGRIRLRNCTLKPSSDGKVAVLSYRPSNFDYQYPIGFARSVTMEDIVVDYSAAPASKSPCWLMDVVPFSKTKQNTRLFFPHRIEFRNITVEGREQGVRLIHLPDPTGYDLSRSGGYDGSRLKPNCTIVCDSVQLEELTPRSLADTGQMHLVIGTGKPLEYADAKALYPKIRFNDCEDVNVYLGDCIASAFFERCGVNTVAASALRGELVSNDCRLQPKVQEAPERFYALESTLGTRFTNCTVHAPVVGGEVAPEMVNRIGFLEVNKSVQHYHLNTALGNEILEGLQREGVALSPGFLAKLSCHYELPGIEQ